MLRWRLVSATVLIGILVAAIYLDYRWNFGRPGIWLMPLAIMISMLCTREVLGLMRAQGLRPAATTTYAAVLAVVGCSCVPVFWQPPAADAAWRLGWILAGLLAGAAVIVGRELVGFRQPGGAVVRMALSGLATAYVGGLMAFLVMLRLVDGRNGLGMAALVSMIIVVKMSDCGAYTAGKLFGRHKLAPTLSPGKTIEGAIGGLMAACVVSWWVFEYLVPWMADVSGPRGVWASVVFGLLVGVAGIVGDLTESLMKRDSGCKDSGNTLPGMGGVLDVMDSVLAAGPVALAWWTCGLVGAG